MNRTTLTHGQRVVNKDMHSAW